MTIFKDPKTSGDGDVWALLLLIYLAVFHIIAFFVYITFLILEHNPVFRIEDAQLLKIFNNIVYRIITFLVVVIEIILFIFAFCVAIFISRF